MNGKEEIKDKQFREKKKRREMKNYCEGRHCERSEAI